MNVLPIPVHVGVKPPDHWDDVEARQNQYRDTASPLLLRQRRPAVASADVAWSDAGFEPRWIGDDSADCAVALQPSIYSGQGEEEFQRFRHGAGSRREVALVIDLIGGQDDESSTRSNIFGPPVAWAFTGDSDTTISGTLAGNGTKVRPVADLDEADAQLALLLTTANPAPRWHRLALVGSGVSGSNQEERPAQGLLVSIVETELGEPVVAAWVSPDGAERRYVMPLETPWALLLTWLMEQALPAVVPGALRRARRQLGTDVLLMTAAERAARDAIAELEASFAARKGELVRQLEAAQQAASPSREGLLFASGRQLEDAVRDVLASAGISVVNLDDALGGTINADLLCSHAGRRRLVEVKSASGSAPERAYHDLIRHLREWPTLPDTTPVDGGTLIVNHERREPPSKRRSDPYERPEFLRAQTQLVVTTLDLFDAWREDDPERIRRLVFGPTADVVEKAAEVEVPPSSHKRLRRSGDHWARRLFGKVGSSANRRP